MSRFDMQLNGIDVQTEGPGPHHFGSQDYRRWTEEVIRRLGLQTTTQRGAFTYSASTGRSGSCTVDITSTFDPEAKTYTRTGTLCGRTVDVTRTVQRS
jgi:hypothetical protein